MNCGDDNHHPVSFHDIYRTFRDKHPHHDDDFLPDIKHAVEEANNGIRRIGRAQNGDVPLPDLQAEVKLEELSKVLDGCNSSSSPGTDGITFFLLKNMCNFKCLQESPENSSDNDDDRQQPNLGERFAYALAEYVTRIIQVRHVSPVEREVLTSTKLHFIPKAGGNTGDTRPIGITSSICRIATKIILRRCTDYACNKVRSYQLALGRSDGCLVGASITQAYYEQGATCMFFDMKNAFNRVSRRLAYAQMLEHMPCIIPIFTLLYGKPSEAYISKGIKLGMITTGVKQGCPLAMLAFCFAINPLLDELKRHTNDTELLFSQQANRLNMVHNQVVAYADDIRICIAPCLLSENPDPRDPQRYSLEDGNRSRWLERCYELFGQYGLVCNHDKTQVLRKSDIANRQIPAKENGTIDLGIPVGDDAYRRLAAAEIASKATQVLVCPQEDGPMSPYSVLSSLKKIDQLHLVRICVASRIYHLCRSLPSSIMMCKVAPESAEPDSANYIFDRNVDMWLRDLIKVDDVHLEDEYFQIIRSITLRNGGFGIRSLTVARGFYSHKLFQEASWSLLRTLATLPLMFEGLIIKIREVREGNGILGSNLWPNRDPYLGHKRWKEDLYHSDFGNNPEEPVVSITYDRFEKTLLQAFHREVLEWDDIPGLEREIDTKAALALRLSIMSSRCSIFSTPALSFQETIKDDCFIWMAKFLFLQPPVQQDEVRYDCSCDVRDEIKAPHFLYHPFVCKKFQGHKVARHNAIINTVLCDVFERAATAINPNSLVTKEPLVRDVIESVFDDPTEVYGKLLNRCDRPEGNNTKYMKFAGNAKFDILIKIGDHYTCIDLGVVSPSSRKGANKFHVKQQPGTIARDYRLKKASKYAPFLPRIGKPGSDRIEFVPFVIELGGFVEEFGAKWLKTFLAKAGMRDELVRTHRLMAKSTARLSICSLMLFRLKVMEGIDPDNAPPQLLEEELLEDPPNPPEGSPDDNFFEDDDALSDRDPPNDNVSMHRRIASPHRLPPPGNDDPCEAIIPAGSGPPGDPDPPPDHMSPERLGHSFHQDPPGGLDAPTDEEHSLGDNDSGYANLPLIQPASPEE